VKARGIFITTLLSINAFLGGFAYGFNSRHVLVIDPALPPVVPAKAAEPAKAIVPVKAAPTKGSVAKSSAGKGSAGKSSAGKSSTAKNSTAKNPASKSSAAKDTHAKSGASAKTDKGLKTGTTATTKSVSGSETKGNK